MTNLKKFQKWLNGQDDVELFFISITGTFGVLFIAVIICLIITSPKVLIILTFLVIGGGSLTLIKKILNRNDNNK